MSSKFQHPGFCMPHTSTPPVTSRNLDRNYNIFRSSELELWVISWYNYGPSLCLRNITMPTYSHAHMLLTHVVSSLTPEINYYRFSYYLPDSNHMPLMDYYFTEAKITDTRSSGIPELHHTFKYINCSTSMYFASLNINLDSLLALISLILLDPRPDPL